jgi:HAD superfamily hydrolase (TIGR01549 family)
MNIKAVIFDLDGTITKTSVKFAPYRQEIGTLEKDVLKYIQTLDVEKQVKMYNLLADYEYRIQQDCMLNEGFLEIMNFLKEKNIQSGIITRSSRKHANKVIEKLNIPIKVVIGRDDVSPKPSGEPLILMSKLLSVSREKMLFVGDFLWDIQAGKNAGVKTVLLLTSYSKDFAHLSDYVIHNLRQIKDIIINS